MSADDQAQHETLVPKGFRRVTPPQWGKVFSVTSRVTVSRERAGALLRGQGLSQETIDIRFAIDALLRSRDIQQIDGPASACFWAGGTSGAWFAYTQYANGQIQPEAAPRVRDRALGSVAELITNAVRTFASLLENRHARGEPMPCAVVWRRHAEIGAENDGALFWGARLAFVPVADMGALSLERPEWVAPAREDLEKRTATVLNRAFSANAETAPKDETIYETHDIGCACARCYERRAARGDGVALISTSHPHSAGCGCTICHPPRRIADDYDFIRERMAAIKEGW